jgi:hypothetical protein
VGDPCSLLTQAEVSAAVGQPVGPGSSADDSKSCDWQYPADGVPNIQATIGIEDGDLSGMCDVPSNSDLGISVDPVSGVGDGACFIQMAGLRAGANLVVSKGGQVFSTSVALPASATISQVEDADKALALDALGRF